MGVGIMTGIRERKTWIVFIAVLLLFAACKGETPTAPPTGGGSPPGTNPPPQADNDPLKAVRVVLSFGEGSGFTGNVTRQIALGPQ